MLGWQKAAARVDVSEEKVQNISGEVVEKRESHRGGEPPDLPVESTQIFKPHACWGDTRGLGEKPAA